MPRTKMTLLVIELVLALGCGVGLLVNSIGKGSATTGLILTVVGAAILMDFKRRFTAPDS